MSLATSGNREQSIWASVVSHDPGRFRGWLLAIGFTQDLLIPGERENAIHDCQLDWPTGGRVMLPGTGERSTPARPGSLAMHVVCSDPDAVLERAEALAARVLSADRRPSGLPSAEFTVADPDGNNGRSQPSPDS